MYLYVYIYLYIYVVNKVATCVCLFSLPESFHESISKSLSLLIQLNPLQSTNNPSTNEDVPTTIISSGSEYFFFRSIKRISFFFQFFVLNCL